MHILKILILGPKRFYDDFITLIPSQFKKKETRDLMSYFFYICVKNICI